jgi:Zn-dependent peptidase ImmA (M78 family)
MGHMISAVKQEAALDAAKLLAVAWNNSLPVAPNAVARRVGVSVKLELLGENTRGVLVVPPSQDSTIVLNESDSENRRRFTCAHELGHFVRRSGRGEEHMTFDLRNAISAAGSDSEEIYANEFAACLLMPENLVRAFHDVGFSDLEMASKFRVSREAMRTRLANLDLTP